jgi:hypothetical protein
MPIRKDDLSIGDEEVLWRGIHPHQIVQQAGGAFRPGSFAFQDNTPFGELSVHIALLTDQVRILKNYPDQSLAAITAGLPRSLGYSVVRDPTADDPSHALICPSPTRSHARLVAKQAVWVVLRGLATP